jgi:hypothetical protein
MVRLGKAKTFECSLSPAQEIFHPTEYPQQRTPDDQATSEFACVLKAAQARAGQPE